MVWYDDAKMYPQNLPCAAACCTHFVKLGKRRKSVREPSAPKEV